MNWEKVKKAGKAVVKFLRSPGALEESLAAAVRDNNIARAKKFIAEGASFGNAGYRSENALSIAVNNGNRDMVEVLLAAGADPNAPVRYSSTTPFLEAAYKNQTDIVAAMLAAKANVNARGDRGNTAYIYAVAAKNKPLADLLLQHDAAIDARNNAGWTPLFYAARNGDMETVKLLIDKGARLDYRDEDGRSALDIAKESDRMAVADRLQAALDAKVPEWQVTKQGELAHVSILRAQGYRLTEVFNFETRQCTVISHNFSTHHDALFVKPFSELSSEAVSAAQTRLAQLAPKPVAQP